ncbi:unnamed protein product, partial [Cyprideis torosa]
MPPEKLDKFRGEHIGMVFQRPYFVENLSLLDNLLLSLYLANKKQDKQVAIEVLTRLGLGDQLAKKPYTLSQGEQQRAAIALAIIKKPALILADEPTSSLDDENCQVVTQLLKENAKLS